MPIDREALVAEGPGLYRLALSLTRDPARASDRVRLACLRTLTSIGRPHHVAALERIAVDDGASEDVRTAAREAIDAITQRAER